MANDKIRAEIVDLLALMNIERVVSIDDMYGEAYGIDILLGLISATEQTVAEELLAKWRIDLSTPSTVHQRLIRNFWKDLSPDEKRDLIDQFRAKQDAIEDTDLAAKQLFGEVFPEKLFRGLSLEQWEKEKKAILGGNGRLLLLIDEDFSKEEGTKTQGREIVREVLENTDPSAVMCGLVSHNYSTEAITDQWQKLCDEEKFDPSRFVLIPKTLIFDDPLVFAGLLKLAIVAKDMDNLRQKASEILLDSLEDAEKALQKINIYDMEEIVFQSSLKEGVWEPETLVRVFSVFHKKSSRDKLFQNEDIHELADKIRKASEIKTNSPARPPHNIWPIQHVELFDDETINALYAPLAIGDIFQRGKTKFVLIYPPCDLAVRRTGEREATIKEGTVAEIVDHERLNGSWCIEYLEQSQKMFVDFKRVHSVKLSVLDLCCLNKDGEARFELGSRPPERLLPSWKKRFELLNKEFEELQQIYDRIAPTDKQKGDVARFIFRSSNSEVFTPTYDPGKTLVRFNFRRIGRLLPPRSEALLRRYSDFLAREAFEQDLETPVAILKK